MRKKRSVPLGKINNDPSWDLAIQWGNVFGPPASRGDFQARRAIMKQILAGDEEIGIPAYTKAEIEQVILALYDASEQGLVEVKSPGFIKFVIKKVIAGTFLSEQKKRRWWKEKKERRGKVRII